MVITILKNPDPRFAGKKVPLPPFANDGTAMFFAEYGSSGYLRSIPEGASLSRRYNELGSLLPDP